MIRSLTVAACVAWATVILAQAQAPRAIPVPVAAEPVLESYRLKPNDIVELTVFGESDLAKSTRILKTGEAVFPLIGAVGVANLTLQEATERIRGLYGADYLRNPKLTLTVIDFAIESVSVVGAVNSPGQVTIPISGKLDLASALASTGGLAPNADPNRITLIRAGGGRSVHSESAIQNTGSIPLSAGDRIVVFESRFLKKSVTILGQVRRPGPLAFPLDGQLDLLTAIGLAGGFTELANPKKVTVSRGENNMLVNMRDGNEQQARQFTLRPDDIVTVAERIF